MTVQYRQVVGYEGYRVGDDGSVWTCRKQMGGRKKGYRFSNEWKRMRFNHHAFGYPMVCLYRNGKPKTIAAHTLVLSAFVGARRKGLVCRHLDGDPRNNKLSNLAWGTYKENEADKERHGTRCRGSGIHGATLADDLVLEIRHRYANGDPLESLASSFNTTRTNICQIAIGATWKHVGGPRTRRPKAKRFTAEQVTEIRRRHASGETQLSIAAAFSCRQGSIWKIVSGATWKHLHTERVCTASGTGLKAVAWEAI